MNEKWKLFHERLQASMKQEIKAMRDMLTNMVQEEACLLSGDKTGWNQIMIERSSLLARLYDLRSQRFEATKLLESLAKDVDVPFDYLLCLEEDDGCEILTMREQLAALVEKMNQQNVRNSGLEGRDFSSLAKERLSFPPPTAPEAVKKGKTTIATYPDKPSS